LQTYCLKKCCANLGTIDLQSLLYKYEVDIVMTIRKVFDNELKLNKDFDLTPFPPTWSIEADSNPHRKCSLTRSPANQCGVVCARRLPPGHDQPNPPARSPSGVYHTGCIRFTNTSFLETFALVYASGTNSNQAVNVSLQTLTCTLGSYPMQTMRCILSHKHVLTHIHWLAAPHPAIQKGDAHSPRRCGEFLLFPQHILTNISSEESEYSYQKVW